MSAYLNAQRYGHGLFPHGQCAYCEKPACHRSSDNGEEVLVCTEHLPPGTIFSPYLGQQEKMYSADERYVLGGGGAGGSKALATWTPIPTPDGWKQMGDLCVGDIVFDDRGNQCSVTATSEVFLDHKCYRVRFDDGEEIVADEGHRWATYDYNERKSLLRQERRIRSGSKHARDQRCVLNGPEVRTTADLFATQKFRGRTNHAIPTAPQLDCGEAALPIEPYLLGVWLGDGDSHTGAVTSADEELIELLTAAGAECSKPKRDPRSRAFRFAIGKKPGRRGPDGRMQSNGSFHSQLKELGLLHNKHIPAAYLRSHALQRMALLQGIVDTDGCVDAKRSRTTISSTIKVLADGIFELAVTLGLKPSIREDVATLNGVECGPVWTVQFTTSRMVARLSRKRNRIHGVNNRTQRWRYIESVEETISVPVKCIAVDSPTHLYLAGRTMVPTHNTYMGARLWLKQWQVENDRYLSAKASGETYVSKGHALFLRRTIPEAVQVVENFKTYYLKIDPGARWNEKYLLCTFSCGYRVQFGGCQDEDDWMKFYGGAYSLLVIDETWQFTVKQITEIDSRVRVGDPVLDEMLQTYYLTNPVGGETKVYLRKNFVEAAPPETTVAREVLLSDGRKKIVTQVYIPSNLFDNPSLVASGDYEANLRGKGSAIQRALLENDWYVDEGAWIGDDWDPEIHVIPPFKIPGGWTRVKSHDYGMAAKGPCHWYAIDPEGGAVCYRARTFRGMTAEQEGVEIRRIEIEAGEWDTERDCSLVFGVADASLWARQGEGPETRGEILQRLGTGFRRAKNTYGTYRDDAADQIRMRLRRRIPDPFDPTGTKTVPALRFFTTTTHKIKSHKRKSKDDGEMTGPILCIPQVPIDKDNPNVWDTTADDHDLDTLGYFCMSRPIEGIATADDNVDPNVISILDELRRERQGSDTFVNWSDDGNAATAD